MDNIEEEEIILSELDDEELKLQMHDDLYDGLGEEIVEGTTILLERGWDPSAVLNDALVEGIRNATVGLIITNTRKNTVEKNQLT